MVQTPITQERAVAYVDGLYKSVLGRTNVNQRELAYWVSQVVSGKDPIDTFFKFVNSEENQRRLTCERNSRTMYENGHFYSPVVNLEELEQQRGRIFGPRDLRSVSLNVSKQIEYFKSISRHFNRVPFSESKDQRYRYYYNNTSYGFGDACVYWGMLAHFKPSRVVEVGSGFTSALALDAIDFYNLDTECVFVDPYPELARKVVGDLSPRHTIIPRPVQNMDLSVIARLKESDILFIDSSHIVKTGSDVHFELSEILPRLQPGVIVHFHDIFYPFEYPIDWVIKDNKSWNELYFIHSFLQYNSQFEIIYFNDYFSKEHGSLIDEFASAQAARIRLNPGGGLWLRRL